MFLAEYLLFIKFSELRGELKVIFKSFGVCSYGLNPKTIPDFLETKGTKGRW
jgi:hypothetical protein